MAVRARELQRVGRAGRRVGGRGGAPYQGEAVRDRMRRRALDVAMALFASGALAGLGAPLHGCTDGERGSAGEPPAASWGACQASDQAFIRRAMLALNGRRPWGQAEVNAYEDIIAGARAAYAAADGSSNK